MRIGDRVVSLHWDQDAAWPSPLTRKGPVDSFLGLTADGGYAEYCTLPEGALVEVPKGWSAAEAAPVMSTFGTVWQGAKIRTNMVEDDVVLITGSSGGVGSSAVKLCKQFGCRKVIAVTSSSSNINFLKSIGADEVIVTNPQETFSKSSIIENVSGCSLAIECVGEPTFLQSLRCLKPEGRMVLVGNVNNSTVNLPIGLCILNSLKVVGSDSIAAEELSSLFDFLTQTGLRPDIDRIMPLEMANDAHALIEKKEVTGRVVLQVSNDNWV